MFHERINSLVEPDEHGRRDFDEFINYQGKTKKKIDKKERHGNFKVDDIVLLWDKNQDKVGNHGNFSSLWLGPFKIDDVAIGRNTF